MNRDNAQTAIIVGIIIIVSTITLVALLYFVWQIVGPPLVGTIQRIQYGAAVNTTSYNFAYPGLTTVGNSGYTLRAKTPKGNNYQKNIQRWYFIQDYLANANYNYRYPNQDFIQSSPRLELAGTEVNFLDQIDLGVLEEKPLNQISDLHIVIPAIGLDAPVLASYNAKQASTNGVWQVPGSVPVAGPQAIGCQRWQTLPKDKANSCWYLDRLQSEDEIYYQRNGQTISTYRVNSVTRQTALQLQLQLSNLGTNLIFTSDIPGLNNQFVVVEFSKIDN